MNGSWLTRAVTTAALGLAGAVQAAGPLPVRPGDYVLVGTACKDAPFAALFHYDGQALSGPHDSRCTTTVLGRSGPDRRLTTKCRALGDGTPTNPSTVVEQYRVHSPTNLGIVEHGRESRRYQWCGN